jgi:hypothetical protein
MRINDPEILEGYRYALRYPTPAVPDVEETKQF